jgi:Ca2+:H+ antiporter
VLYLTFALVTHPALFAGPSAAEEEKAPISVGRSVSVLAAATVAIAWMSEIMVSAIEPTTHEFGLSKVFVGVFVVAILEQHPRLRISEQIFCCRARTRQSS